MIYRPTKRELLWILLVIALSVVTILVIGVFGFFAIIAGSVLVLAILIRPALGLIMLIFAGTCFQILGSSHLSGLPISAGKILGILTLAAWLLQTMQQRLPFTYTPQMNALAIFTIVVVVSAAIFPSKEISLEGVFKFLQVYLFYFLIANLAGESKKNLLLICAGLTVAMSISGLIGIMEHFIPSFAIESDDPRLGMGVVGAVLDRESVAGVNIKRITGGIGDANWLAYTMAATLPLNVFWWRKYQTFWPRIFILIATALQLAGLILSYTRTGLLGFAVAVIYMIYKKRLPLAPILGLVFAGSILFMIWQPPGFFERVLSINYLKEGSTPMRTDLYRAALHMSKERPFFGYGYGQFGYEFIDRLTTDMSMRVGAWGAELEKAIESGQEQIHNIGAHSLYLEIQIEYGLFGLIPFLFFMFLILRDYRLAEKNGDRDVRELAIYLMAGALAFYVCGLLGHAKMLKIFWILAGLAAAIRRITIVGDTIPSPTGRYSAVNSIIAK